MSLSNAPSPNLEPWQSHAPALGVYVHIPFCVLKCAYCDFNSYAGLSELHAPYVAALISELQLQTERADRPIVDTVYVGGGTPTVLPPDAVGSILTALHECCRVAADAEITLEANPGTVSRQTLHALRGHGVNRLSLGVQSFDDAELRLLGRIHSAAQAREAVSAARAAGFTNLNLDLIYGLPYQSVAGWLTSLEGALRLEPDHLSLYCLTLEEGTPLYEEVSRGSVPASDPDLAAEMYERARDLLARHGFVHYELSNWARHATTSRYNSRLSLEPGCRSCRHNLKYWTGQPYLGIGAGAHSYLNSVRWRNVSQPAAYIDAISHSGSARCDEELITTEGRMAEAMFLGLRLVAGVRWSELYARLGCDLRRKYVLELAELDSEGLLTVDAESARLTPRGQLLANQVFVRFLSSCERSGRPGADRE